MIITLTHDKVVIVSDEDFAELSKFTWQFCDGYAVRYVKNVRPYKIYMHRQIMGVLKNKTVLIDHINQDKLDCQRQNLRITTKA